MGFSGGATSTFGVQARSEKAKNPHHTRGLLRGLEKSVMTRIGSTAMEAELELSEAQQEPDPERALFPGFGRGLIESGAEFPFRSSS